MTIPTPPRPRIVLLSLRRWRLQLGPTQRRRLPLGSTLVTKAPAWSHQTGTPLVSKTALKCDGFAEGSVVKNLGELEDASLVNV